MLRIYKTDTNQHNLYKEMYKNQTYENVLKKIDTYNNLNKKRLKMKEALDMLDDFIDPSDPDMDLPNSVHAYQTAERIRKDYPENYAYQVIGLIHDVGKILFKFGEEPYNVVGDTYVVGAKFPESIVYYESIKENPNFNNPKYNSLLGVYSENCGIDNVKISYGHDEYLYNVLLKNKHSLPYKYARIIRYHSLYPWHSSDEYRHFMNDDDYILLEQVRDFNKYDLYSKEDTNFELTNKIKDYYESLLNLFFPELLNW
jgi:inositol oxygenase